MFDCNEALVKFNTEKVDVIQGQLFNAQLKLIKAYERQWVDMNYLIENGQWGRRAVFKANAYGLRVGDEMYVFQLDATLPFLPNTYNWRFKEYHESFLSAKLLVSFQLRDVIQQLGAGMMHQPSALFIKHYYHGDVQIFDLDNKAKQVVINTLRGKLIKDDSAKTLKFYSEEAIWDGKETRTMLYIGPDSKRVLLDEEIVEQYSSIRDMPRVIKGRERV